MDAIYQHRLRLCGRAGLDFEDKDLLELVSAYDRLNQLIANQGWHDAALPADG